MNKFVSYLLIFFILILILLWFIFYSYTKKKVESPHISPTIIPTIIDNKHPTRATNIISPSARPTLFTGALNIELPKEMADLAKQRQTLRKRLPLSEQFFNIDFDYGNDMFLVSLKEPKEESRKNFETWLKNNYLNIPLADFSIK